MKSQLDIPRALDGQLWRYRLPGPVQPVHQHAELELDLVVRGEATLQVGEQRVALAPRGLLWLYPGVPHGVVAHSDDFEMWIACFRSRLVRRVTTTRESRSLRGRARAPAACRVLVEADARSLGNLLAEVSAYEDSATYNAGLGHVLLHAWQMWGHATDEA